jgi:carbon monoxide dehydrogenase subunit G
MEITGTQVIAASRADVWSALNDPAVLRQCLPGCESVERGAADEFKVIVVSAIGPLRARFNGMLRLTQVQAPSSCVMVFEGQGGAVGFGKGSSAVTLREKDGQTELSYSAQAQVGGKLAQVGSRLIDSVARKMSDDFFKAFRRQFEAPEPATQPAVARARPAADADLPTETQVADAAMAGPDTRVGATGTMVPAWWLVVAVALGAAAAIAATLLVR